MSDSNDNNASLLQFPCAFPIKIIGKSTVEFQGDVLAVFRKYVPDLGEGAVTEHYSSSQHYLSLTVTIMATSQEQLDAIYAELSGNKHVIMAL